MDQRKKLSAILGVELKLYKLLGWAVRGYCAMKPEETTEEGGKKALAHNRTAQMVVYGYGDKDIHLVRAIATCNPKLAGTREVVTRYINFRRRCGGLWDVMVAQQWVIYGVKRRDFKKMRVLLAAAGIFVTDMTHAAAAVRPTKKEAPRSPAGGAVVAVLFLHDAHR